jgi:hypothetical protein
LSLLKCLLVKELYLLELLRRHARQHCQVAGAEGAGAWHGRRGRGQLEGLFETNATLAHGSIPVVQLEEVRAAFLAPPSSVRPPHGVELAPTGQIVFRKIVSAKLLPLVNWFAYNTAQSKEA